MAAIAITEPFPIHQVANRYLLFDIDTITYTRRVHHICGVLIGNIPHAAQQNVFSGIPLELMPEEARMLVERNHAYLIDDVAAHLQGLKSLTMEEMLEYKTNLAQEGTEASIAQQRQSLGRKAKFFDKLSNGSVTTKSRKSSVSSQNQNENSSESLTEIFDSIPRSSHSTSPTLAVPKVDEPLLITRTTSYPPLKASQPNVPLPLPETPSSYPLFTHLHSKGYFLSPGLRFGCQYVAYPGDPLRFHSHFLAVGAEWDEEFDLLDVVGGGRLGTAVKKGYLLGGAERKSDGGEEDGEVRTFCFEWAAM